MRTLVALALLWLAIAPAAVAQRTVDVGRPLDPGGLVRIWNLSGPIRITGWDRDSIAVQGVIAPGDDFGFGGSRTAVKLGVEPPAGAEWQPRGTRLDVRVPRRSQVWLKSGAGDIEVLDFAGGVDAYSVSGRIHIAGTPREVNAESMGGDIEIRAVSSSVRARSASGAVLVDGGGGDAVATTVSGRLTLRGDGFQRGRLESVDGDILYEAGLRKGADLELSSHSGTVELVLSAGATGEFTIQTYQGEVQNDFGPTRLATVRELQGKSLGFTLGAFDGTRVSVRNFKGKIVLRRR